MYGGVINGTINTISIHFAFAKVVRENRYARGNAKIVAITVTVSPNKSEFPIVSKYA